jgi:hypothetical protein
MTSMLPPDAAERLSAYLATHHLPAGLGTKEEACSIAAINLVLTGELTDETPDCMSMIIGAWIRRIQDPMPDTMRNSEQWKTLLPAAAGTGRNSDDERRRVDLIIEWLWTTVLPSVQPVADLHGFGEEWRRMTTAKAANATNAANAANAAANAAHAANAANAAHAADAASHAATAASDAAANAAAANAYDAYDAAADAADAAYAAVNAVNAVNAAAAWETFDPPGLLARLIDATGDDDA